VVVDAKGRSGGLATGWCLKHCNCERIWGFESGIGLNIFSVELGCSLTLVNIYGPYADRKCYWDSLAKCSWFTEQEVIVAGDLNFSLGAAEVWGPQTSPEPLPDYFTHFLDLHGLLDLEPVKLQSTWQNRWVRVDRVAKQLDRLLLKEDLVDTLALARQWVACSGESDHNPIVLELCGRVCRAPIPFKFFEGWLKDPEYQALVHKLWSPLGQEQTSHATILFLENLKKVKHATISWAHEKKLKEDQKLLNIEKMLVGMAGRP
jgi:hypothetical protein